MANHIYPSKEAVYKMYKFLSAFEKSVSNDAGHFDFGSDMFQKFIESKDIIIRPVSKSKYINDLHRNNYIVYIYGDHKAEYDDKAHDLLRHIRNAIGHALIKKVAVNKTYFDVTDKNKNGSLTLRGNIDESLFFALIEQLIATKK